jgi:ATP-dependent RNA helicase DeaD
MTNTEVSGDTPPDFEALGLVPELLQTLGALGYEEPSPIQREAIPPLLEGRDLVGQAATGTGKSAAFALPLIQRLVEEAPAPDRRGPHPAVLMLVPTRELAMQLSEAVYRYGRSLGVRVLPIYGGQSFSQQLKVLKRGVDVIVATPGRAMDHIRRGTLHLEDLLAVVLDEADEMLDMGFVEDLESILAATPSTRQTVLFSATMPPRIAQIARQHLQDPVQVRIQAPRQTPGEAAKVREVVYFVSRTHKMASLGRVLDMEDPEAGIIFCRTRVEVDELTEHLNARGYRTEALHGGMNQEQRDRVMKKIRSGSLDLLTATDVAARGLDIPRLTHVINFDVPNAPEAYVHRIGRVGRAGREGVAITLAELRERRFVSNIEHLTKRKLPVASLPTLSDLRDRRLEVLRAGLEEILEAGDLDRFRAMVDDLAYDVHPLDVAAAALRMLQDAQGGLASEEAEIPEIRLDRSPGHGSGSGSSAGAGARSGAGRGAASAGRGAPGAGKGGPRRGPTGPRISINIGRAAGIRPQDLVGAITGEAGIAGHQIGRIELGEKFSFVEVAPEVVDHVVAALHGNQIRGKRILVRTERVERAGRAGRKGRD